VNISILLATRNRPHNLRRLYRSIQDTATVMPEVIVAIDDDDKVSVSVAEELGFKYIQGPRIPLSKIYTKLAEAFTGDILMYGADDMVFRKKGWDDIVRADFEKYPDNILLVHSNDGIQGEGLAAFGFLHRKWVETLGYLFPPHFATVYQDTWITEAAKAVNRKIYHAFMIVAHMHHTAGKAPMDATYAEGILKNEGDRLLWESTQSLLAKDIVKLKAVIGGAA
jgi:glycosyltransferase involved in cell wall biosynthesis